MTHIAHRATDEFPLYPDSDLSADIKDGPFGAKSGSRRNQIIGIRDSG
jgi:hypothetical protein